MKKTSSLIGLLIGLLLSIGFVAYWNRDHGQVEQVQATVTPLAAPSEKTANKITTVSVPILQDAELSSQPLPRGNVLLAEKKTHEYKAISEPAFARFAKWSEEFMQADAAGRLALEAEGIALAKERRTAMLEMIQVNPERALQLTVSYDLRSELPSSITDILEERISGRGKIEVGHAAGEKGCYSAQWAQLGERHFEAFTYGRRANGKTRDNVSINGIAVDRFLAVHENPVRVLEPSQAAAEIAAVKDKKSEKICPSEKLTVVEAVGKVRFLCEPEQVEDLNEQLIGEEEILLIPQTLSSGVKDSLMVRLKFPGESSFASDNTELTTTHNRTSSFFQENSYGDCSLSAMNGGSSIITLTMTNAKSFYANKAPSKLVNDVLGEVAHGNYQMVCIVFTRVYGTSWYGYAPGGKAILMNLPPEGFSPNILAHEYGHTFNLNHASTWNPSTSNPIGSGANSTYGDRFDIMGEMSWKANWNLGKEHYSAFNKAGGLTESWIRSQDFVTVTTNNTYRIYAHDNINSRGGSPARQLALKIVKNTSKTYWVEHRQRFDNNWLLNGASIRFRWTISDPEFGNSSTQLLDMTPGSKTGTADFSDHPLVIGTTFSDTTDNIHITPVGKGSTTINGATVGWLDVRVNQNVGANVAPMISSISGPTSGGANENLTFTANATDQDGNALAYYWDFYDGTVYNDDFQSSNNKTIVKSWSSTGTYKVRCTVTDMRGGVVSKVLTVDIDNTPAAPVITSQPQSQTVAVGANATFSVTATGTSKNYQWKFNGGNISGATASTYTRSNVQTSHAGNYTVVVSNTGGSDTSANAVLTVQTPINITGQPQGQTNNVGANVTFTVTATGTSPTYQWRFNGGNISGATGSSYTRSNIQAAHEGNYSVVVANGLGSVTSANAFLKVIEPIVITSQPLSQTNNVGANVTFSVAATGTSLKYQWRFGGVDISGATTSALVKNNIQLADEGNYSVRITNSSYTNISANAHLTVREVISIDSQPKSRTNNIGDNARFAVTASGSATLGYQWRLGGVNISGATGSALDISVATTNSAGNYSVVVSSPTATNVTSANALLAIPYAGKVKLAQWDFNSVSSDADPDTGVFTTSLGSGTLPGNGGQVGNMTLNSWLVGSSSDIASLGTDNSGRSLQGPNTTGTANKSAGFRFDVSTVGYKDLIVTWEQYNNARACAYWRGQYTTNGGTTWIDRGVVDKRAPFIANGGSGYTFHFDNLTGVAGVNDNPNFAYRLVGEHQSTATGSGSAAYVPCDPNDTYNTAGAIRWDMVTVMGTEFVVPITISSQPQSATVVVGANHTFDVTAGGTSPSYQWRFNGANISGKTTSALALTNLQLTNSGSYTVVITNSASSLTSSVAALTVQATISIIGQPQSQTNYVSSNVTFTVTATGTSPLYQWRFNAANISGATQSSYTRSNIQLSDAGNYSVVVSNSVSTVTSADAALAVLPIPVERYWSGNGTSLGGAGTWNTADSRWGFTAGGPFGHIWNNATGNNAIFVGNGVAPGTVTVGANVTANKIIITNSASGNYNFTGTNTITLSGENAEIEIAGANNTSATNLVLMTNKLAGAAVTKTGGGRLNLFDTGTTVGKWIVKQGAITVATGVNAGALGNPAQLVSDFVTLDGGGLGFGASGSLALGTNRGIYLGAGGGQIGNNGSSGIITIDGPITGPGALHFPGVTEWPGQVQGDNATFIISNTGNDYQGETRIATAEIRLGNNQVFPATTTLNITNGAINGRLNLNGFQQEVVKVILDSTTGNSRIFDSVGGGSLSAEEFDLRRSAYSGASVSAVLTGSGFLKKTTSGNITLSAANSYSGDTLLQEGTITLDGSARLGNGAGTLNLSGGGIILTQTQPEDPATPLFNPIVMTTNTTIQNGDTGTNALFFRHDGSWTTSSGILTIRNTTSTGSGSFGLVLANAFTFTQPIVIGLGGEKPCQLASFNPEGMDQTFSGVISGIGSFWRSVEDGVEIGGQTTLSGSNTYSGGTIVDAGMLAVNNASGSGTGAGSVTVSGRGTLQGIGIVGGSVSVSNGGSISAGNGVGVLTLGNGLDMSGGGTNIWELAEWKDDSTGVAGTDFDQLVLTGGELQLGGSSRLMLSFSGSTAPNDFDSFWRVNHSWKIVSLNGGSNPGGTTFASIVNGTYNCGTFTAQADGSGNIILNFTTSFAGVLWWSGNGSTLGGVGVWDTTNARFGLSNASPFNLVWNNANTNSAIFAGSGATPGNVTNNAAIMVNKITVTNSSSAAYVFAGTNTITFAGSGAGVFVQGANNGNTTTNNVTFNAKLAGSVVTKTGGGRMNMNNTGNSVGKWVVTKGAINGASADVLFGTGIPAALVTDFVTLDGGGLGFGASGAMTMGANRGIYLGTGGGQIGNNGTGGIITINGPISGPGDLHFPGVTEWPGQVQGDNATFVISNTNNSYGGWTRIATAEVRLGNHQVFPATTTLDITNGTINGRLNLNGFNQTVAKVILDSTTGSSRIFDSVGGGSLSAGQFELRRTASTAGVSAVLAGSGFLTKTTTGNVTLTATNTYTGDTIISDGTLTIDAIGRFGNGAGLLNLAGGGIIQSTNRPETNTLLNPALLSANSTIQNGDIGTGAVLFRHGGTWETEAGTLTIRNTTSTGAGSFDVVLTNAFSFNQPIVIGLAGDKPCQLTSFNPALGPNSELLEQVFNGQISGVGTFRRSVSTGAAGQTAFTADNTYSGGTIVDAGTLLVDNPGPGSGTGTNTVTVSGTGTLGGSGFIGGNVVVNTGGSISAGIVVGQLTLQNGLNLSGGGTNIWELATPADDNIGVPGVDFDQLVLSGGNLALGGTSKLVLKFTGDATTPDISDSFWRINHTWTIARLNGGSNTGNTKFTTIVNATNAAGYFANSVDGSGNVILTFTSFSTNDLFWAGNGTTVGGAGTWNTTSNRWGNTASGSFSQAWNNASGKGAIFESTGGVITLGTPITVKKITVGVGGYSFDGTNLTFSGTGAGVDYQATASALTFNNVLAGSLMTKTGAGRMHLNNTGSTVSKWAVKGGIISVQGVNRFGAAPGSLVSDFITLDGGGIGFEGTSPTMGSTRGITVGTNGPNIFGVRPGSGVTLTIDAPITGPGGISFPGYSSFATGIYGAGEEFVLNNVSNNYQGETSVKVGTLKLGAAGVLPDITTASIVGSSAKLNLNGFNETVANVLLNGSSAQIIGSGVLTVTNNYDVRRSGNVTAILAGNANLIKTSTNTATLSGANTYTGGTVINEGTLLINNATGSGTGTGSVTVEGSEGVLGGTGFISGNVIVNEGGNVNPGIAGAGKLTLQNGLNMSTGGTSIWELGALKDNSSGTAGTDFDQLVLTGGQLVLGGSSELVIQYSGTASAPDLSVSFWQTNRTWTIVNLNGGQNTTNLTFASIANGTYEAGTFTTSISGGSILLTYTANPSRPPGTELVAPPQSVIEYSNAGAPNVLIRWNAVPNGEYEVHYTTDLSTGVWYLLTDVVADNGSVSVTDFPANGEPQRFYRLMAK